MMVSEDFKNELEKSGWIHEPLSDVTGHSLEEKRKKVKVMNKKALGDGKILVLEGKTVTYCWPPEMSQDGDCAFYGTLHQRLEFERENWEDYDRLRFSVRPKCDGTRIVNITVGIVNDGAIKVPDEYFREGSHVVELRNHEWNDCLWEFGSMARDAITEVDFSCRQNGKDTASGDDIVYEIKDIILEKVEKPCKDKGWECEEGKVAYATTGYFCQGKKTAVTNRTEDVFYIVSDDMGTLVYSDKIKKIQFQGKEYGILDFSPVNEEGRYRIQVGDFRSEMFSISNEIYEEASWKVLNFLFCERCGYPVPRKHGICHMDVTAKHDGKTVSFCGGWHDAGDMSQQMIHTAETTDALYRLAETVKDSDKILYKRLLEEAGWGLEFILRTRFQDGYRATSAGLVRWTNGFIGDQDDVETRGHNHALENLLCSAICSHAAKVLESEDRELAWKCGQAAKEDFEFGMKRFREVGMELPIMWEHTYNASLSQYAAVIVMAASGLYSLFEEDSYADVAAEYVTYLLSCQEIQAKEIKGYFYRDDTKKSIVHFTHQSREYLFVQALTEFAKVIPARSLKSRVDAAINLYGEYLEKLMEHASPYEMFPAGVFETREVEDRETFELLHLLVDYEQQKEHYLAQLKEGTQIDTDKYIRQFPVWFSFRGNTAIHMALGRAAGILGNYLKEDKYLQMAREQLYWINGKNPFRQSLIYGEGYDYANQYAVMPGEMIGEMPVGIETYEDEDIPYWPHTNNATYKEVWTSSANRWLWTLAEVKKQKGR